MIAQFLSSLNLPWDAWLSLIFNFLCFLFLIFCKICGFEIVGVDK